MSSIAENFKKYPLRWVLAVVMVALLGAGYYRYSGIADIEESLAQKSTEGERLKANLANSALLKEQVDALDADLQQVNDRLVRAEDLAKNLQYFYKLEAETGVKLTDLRQLPLGQAPKGQGGAFTPVPYAVSVRGNFAQLIAFIRRLETGAFFCRLNIVSFSRNGAGEQTASGGEGNLLNLTLNLDLLGKA